MSAPLPLLLLLESKREFVSQALAAGKVPSPAMLAAFLQALVQEMAPHIKSAAPAAVQTLKEGLAALGWVVQTNAPKAGSAPPAPDQVLAFLEASLNQLVPEVSAAKAAASQASQAAQDEERELRMLEEEETDCGGLSAKQQKALAVARAKLPGLQATASEAARVVEFVLARLSADERTAADAAAAQRRDAERLRIADLTKAAATAAAGKGHSAGRAAAGPPSSRSSGGKGSSRGGGGGGGGNDAFEASTDREARAAETAARQAAKAANEAKATEEALAALRTSDISLVPASELRKGGYVCLPVSGRDEPCRVQELTTSKTGKHGHTKISIIATDVASGRKVERNLRADENVTVPGKRWVLAISGA